MVGTGVSGLGHIPILGCKRLNNISQIIKALFAKGEQGFAYDFNDFSTMFQDAAGNIPVTAVGQPVGLVLDKSKGLNLGVELFTKFDSTLSATLSSVNTPCVVTSTVSMGVYGAVANVNFVPGVYKIDFAWEGNVINREMFVAMPDGNNLSLGFATTGTYSKVIRFNSQGGMAIMQSPSAVGQTFTIKQLSIKSVLGNHAYQTVSASRPLLRASTIPTPELLANSGFNTDITSWTPYRSPTYSVSGGQLTMSTGADTAGLYQDIPTEVGSTYSVNITKAGNISVGVYGGAGFTNTIILTLSTSFTFVATSTTTRIYVYCNPNNNGVVNDISVRKLIGYAIDKNYLLFDGVDDFLQTNSIDFTATDKVSLFAGVRKLSDVATATVFELSASKNTNSGVFALFAPVDGGVSQMAWITKGTTERAAVNNTIAAPITTVISAKGSISGDVSTLKVNGTQVSNSLDQGTGNYGNYPLYIGRRGGTSLPFSGHIYSLIGIARLTTDAETLATEKIIAKLTGVTL